MKTGNKWSIPTTYNGTRFRSKLEASWAKFFDTHRMKWAYESEGFDFDGVWYLPDFWLPEIRTFVEVKGILDDKDNEKIERLTRTASDRGITTIVAEAPCPYSFRIGYPTPQTIAIPPFNPEDPEETFGLHSDVDLAKCAKCLKWYFRDTCMSWACTACGFYDGSGTYSQIHPESLNDYYRKCAECGGGGR